MIIHIDMDAFFAAVELRERPELAGLPVVVGGTADSRGVVAAASYEARRYGVRSAMPMTKAMRLCPQLIRLPSNMELYVSVSRQIHRIFSRYTPTIEPLSLDEAFLDVTASEKLFGTAADIARQIKSDIKSECALIASAGVAPNKFVAKIASDIDKPDGLVVVESSAMQAFLDPLPVSRIWGVGRKTEQQLLQHGLSTIRDVRTADPRWLVEQFGKFGQHIYQLACGHDSREVIADARAKSISSETTFAEDLQDDQALLSILLQLTEAVSARLRDNGVEGKTVNIKIRFHDFRTITRSRTLTEASHHTQLIWVTAKQLFIDARRVNREPVRLLGIGVSGFDQEMSGQGDLFEQDHAQDRLDVVSDQINRRFGKAKIHRARTINKP